MTDQTKGLPKLGAPAQRALSSAGYTTLAQLASARAADLLSLHGVGPKAVTVLREALAESGMAFADEQSSSEGTPAKR